MTTFRPRPARLPRRLIVGTLAFLILSPYTVSFSSEGGGTLLVFNDTQYYLHLLIDAEPFLYVAPGRSVNTKAEAGSHVVRAFYAPGQGVYGETSRVMEISLTATQENLSSCNNNESCNRSTCSSESETSISYGSATWHVIADSLVGGAQ